MSTARMVGGLTAQRMVVTLVSSWLRCIVLSEAACYYIRVHNMGRKIFPVEVRRVALDCFAAGRPITGIARALGIGSQSMSRWHRRCGIDEGCEPEMTSAEAAELAISNKGPEPHPGEFSAQVRAACHRKHRHWVKY